MSDASELGVEELGGTHALDDEDDHTPDHAMDHTLAKDFRVLSTLWLAPPPPQFIASHIVRDDPSGGRYNDATNTQISFGTVRAVTSTLALLSTSVLVLSILLLARQVAEARRSAYAGAFAFVYGILQEGPMRDKRGHVLRVLALRGYSDWEASDVRIAEEVCQAFDSVGIVCRTGMLPDAVIADSWGDSLSKCWSVLSPLVGDYRTVRGERYWNDFEWLAARARSYESRKPPTRIRLTVARIVRGPGVYHRSDLS